jgi:hypothetical protein
VRSVVVYPAMTRSQAVAVLDELAQQREPYYIDGCLHVDVVDDSEGLPLFLGWEPAEIEALERVIGHRPTWCVMIHMSWILEAPPAARRLALELLRGGGAAKDDYSFYPWTASEIGENRAVEDRRFGYPGVEP